MKTIDLIVGVKAEHTLRDAVRAAAEKPQDDGKAIDLSPIGNKDWIAGERIGSSSTFGKMEEIIGSTMLRLINLKSQQRIRRDNIKVFATSKPVPVFKEPLPDNLSDEELGLKENKDTVICPVCKAEVHRYNARFDSKDRMVGCYICRGFGRVDGDR